VLVFRFVESAQSRSTTGGGAMMNMTAVSGKMLEHQGRSLEEAWLEGHGAWEAGRAFRLARIKAIIRNAARWTRLGRRGAAVPEFDWTGTPSDVPLEAIVGVVDEQGRRTAHVPMLRQRMAEAWRRTYAERDHDAHLPLSVVPEADGCYLAGGSRALLYLEIMRARGARLVPVRATSVRQLISGECPENDDCCGAECQSA
jgi:hypothetical protein